MCVCVAVNALNLVTLGHESLKQCTCVSAEDCGTEVLTRQQQRLGWGGGWRERNEWLRSGNGKMIWKEVENDKGGGREGQTEKKLKWRDVGKRNE